MNTDSTSQHVPSAAWAHASGSPVPFASLSAGAGRPVAAAPPRGMVGEPPVAAWPESPETIIIITPDHPSQNAGGIMTLLAACLSSISPFRVRPSPPAPPAPPRTPPAAVGAASPAAVRSPPPSWRAAAPSAAAQSSSAPRHPDPPCRARPRRSRLCGRDAGSSPGQCWLRR